MRLQPANFVQFDLPLRQRWIDRELSESLIVDRLDFGNDERERSSDLREQVLNLSGPGEVLSVGVVLRQLERGKMVKAFQFEIELLLKFQTLRQIFCRRAELAFPLFDSRICLLYPNKIFLPFADIGEQRRQVPCIGLGNFSARWNVHDRLSHKVHKGRTGTPELYRGDLCASSLTAGWRAILRIAFSNNCFPGGILGQGEAPDGCGNGMRSKGYSARRARNLRPITCSNFAHSMNCAIASRPTGIIRCGFKILISSSIQDEQLRISSGAGTRSVPPGDLPGKQRQTAAK